MSSNVGKLLVPEFRFPEFLSSVGWSQKPLHKAALFVKERIALEDISPKNYVSTENLLQGFMGMEPSSNRPPNGSATKFKINDVLISNIRPYLKKIWVAKIEGGASNDVIVIRTKDVVLNQYLSQLLKSDSFIAYVMTGAKGVKMPRGDVELIKKFVVAIPKNPDEQQKIADFLSSLDDLITAQAKKTEALKAHKKGLMQQLFPAEGETLPRLRFPEFRNSKGWKIRALDEFITERNEYPKEKVSLFSLTLEDGVTAKTERYERSFLVSNEENAYKMVLPNDFAYNPMNLRFGAIARHSGAQSVALSKYYNIFHCNQTVSSKFCEAYFRSHRMIMFYGNMAAGSLIEKRRVHFSEFLKFKIPFPSLSEQQKIADCLSSVDRLITAHTQKLEALKAHKKGLMQGLFPSMSEAEA